MNRILKLQQKVLKFPFGRRIFSKIVAGYAPYFRTIDPTIEELRPNYMRASMRKTSAVHNHLKTVHAIACCNLCEFAAGICMEASIPKHRRWIPIGMQVQYLKKAGTNLTAEVDLSGTEWDTVEVVPCKVDVKDTNGVVVVSAVIDMKVSDKKKK